ncbi:hypothetical protein OAK75_03590 [Bacteriovoracales bacterium]|nr:hypothetical protein [Bacteriovoracales bacterium]
MSILLNKKMAFFLLFSLASFVLGSQEKDNVRFQYKKYEKFDFEDLVIEGETSSPSDLSIKPNYNKKFKNLLPYRKNFNSEIKKSIERIR